MHRMFSLQYVHGHARKIKSCFYPIGQLFAFIVGNSRYSITKNNEQYYFTVGASNPISSTTTTTNLNDPTINTAAIKLIPAPAPTPATNQNVVAFTPSYNSAHINNINNINGNIHTTISPSAGPAHNHNQERNQLAYSFNVQSSQNGTAIKETHHGHENPTSRYLQDSQPQQPAVAPALFNFNQIYTNHVQNTNLISPTNLQTIILPTPNGTHRQFVIANPGGGSGSTLKSTEQQPSSQEVIDLNFKIKNERRNSNCKGDSNFKVAAPIPATCDNIARATPKPNSIPTTTKPSTPTQLVTTTKSGGQVICTKCNKIFANKYTLKTHQRTHLGIKDYKCEICDKCFSQKINLMYHMKTHSGEKGFLCPICSKTFTQLGNCRAHCLKKHGVEIEKRRRGGGGGGGGKTEVNFTCRPVSSIGTSTNLVQNGVNINSMPPSQYSTVNIANLMDMNLKYETFQNTTAMKR